ncbi:sarcosine oxidase subunit gamma [Tritonibacter scottomollicae]|uniref:Sarcosine oxidase subunit gamma n=1 Tax=Tritonibacter scottomollicae TaxID=483013 RepID=A0ABZ0HEE5_TRISK|nr:sarcosine oxidase subunit gamma [Tritonibacter scottomollicae]WOI33208.1 sarcosine oxidase subunit gamma [Tritonibacter scottomollicae]
MPDPSPTPRLSARTAFGATTARLDSLGPWTLTERPDRALASVAARAADPQQVADRLASRVGGAIALGQLAQGEDHDIFGTAQNQWFVMADHTQQEDLARQLKTELGDMASVTEQNDGWVVFNLSGAGVCRVLERLVMADLAQMPDDSAQRLLLEHMNVVLLCRQHDQSYDILVARSFALSLHHAVTTAMRSAAVLATPS